MRVARLFSPATRRSTSVLTAPTSGVCHTRLAAVCPIPELLRKSKVLGRTIGTPVDLAQQARFISGGQRVSRSPRAYRRYNGALGAPELCSLKLMMSQLHTAAVLSADDAPLARRFLVRFGAGFYIELRPPSTPGSNGSGKEGLEYFSGMNSAALRNFVMADPSIFFGDVKEWLKGRCRMMVAVSAEEDEPSTAELARAVELKGMRTLGKLLDGAPEGHVWIDFQRLTATAESGDARFPALPEPITFKDSGLLDATGAPMHVTEIPSTGPFYLEDGAFKVLVRWTEGRPTKSDPKLLALVGPVKSGKTAMLTEVIPHLLAAQHAVEKGPTPVFVHWRFGENKRPAAAADMLVKYVAGQALAMGFRIFGLPSTPEDSLLSLHLVMREFAAGIAARGGEMVLLLDEAQNPVIAADTPEEALDFGRALKEMHTELLALSRVALTGSGMITFLDTIRSVPTTGYALWSVMSRLHLGATPPRETALAIADATLTFRRRTRRWKGDVAKLITPQYVVELLERGKDDDVDVDGTTLPPLTAPRQAMVAYIGDMVAYAENPSAKEVVSFAFSRLKRKLIEEAKFDAATALRNMSALWRKRMYRVASEEMSRAELVAGLGKSEDVRSVELLDSFCEPQSSNSAGHSDRNLRLLAPYPVLFRLILNPDGCLRLRWHRKKWRLDDNLFRRIKFISELV